MRTRGLVAGLLGVGLVVSACADHLCGLVGCVPEVEVTFSNPIEVGYELTVVLGGESWTMDCRDGVMRGSCSALGFTLSADDAEMEAAELRVTVVDAETGETLVEDGALEDVSTWTHYPNGKDCGPGCTMVEAVLVTPK